MSNLLLKNLKPEDVVNFFLSFNIGKEEECWEWQEGRTGSGYGHLWMYTGEKKEDVPAHRASYCIFMGEAPADMLVCHKCDNPPCINPIHLFLGTATDNALDMVNKGRNTPTSYANGYTREHLYRDVHVNAKIKTSQIPDIIKLTKEGMSRQEIADKYNVTRPCIGGILRKHAPELIKTRKLMNRLASNKVKTQLKEVESGTVSF